ncbi:hypothetical protein JEY40_24660 [Bradyrhizobium japonicum]|uniref:hypothetical protein n=1 Tax=Bradyrhizobium japonicum TaxID=375 RepID=UPI00200D9EF4|nr:hypothetical protein [Bradyrhizobium japonicum]UQD69211.1 hypothetical protein JEY40_24660 [Bradyrhizobium japonicum]WAX24473.1 hypothetical protein [Bradyrhizobium phage ppBjS10J-1]
MAEGHGLHVEFYIEAVKQEFLSEQEGRPIYKDTEFVKILIPGDKNYCAEREATKADKDRFALEYARFKNGLKEEEQAIGTPLKHWPAMTRSMAKEFASFNIHTVEQLAGMSDTAKQAFGMGANEWSRKAQAMLDMAAGGAAAEKYATENEALKQRIADMEKQFAELSAKVDPEKRGPGRPRKPENPVHELTEAL